MSGLDQLGLVVGVADLAVGGAADGRIVTYALGSCIGLTAFDPATKIGGMLHFMLPQPSANSDPRGRNHCMYVTTGLPTLLRRLTAAGAEPRRLVLTAAGGAETLTGRGNMAIGRRNHTMLRKALWKMNLRLAGEDIGGAHARTLSLDLFTGVVEVRTRAGDRLLWQPGDADPSAYEPAMARRR